MTAQRFAPVLTDAEYAAAFSAFRRHTNQRAHMESWLERNSAKLVPNQNQLSVLSVGTGTGSIDLALIGMLQPIVQRVTYTALEPNEKMLDEFVASLREAKYEHVDLVLERTSFQQFMQGEERVHFDLVHFIHSLYFIPNQVSAVKWALHRVVPGGTVLILTSMLAGAQDLRLRFTERATGKAFATYPAEQLIKDLDAAEIPYHFEMLPAVTEITDCFLADSRDGALLLDFFIECRSKELSPEFRSEVLGHMAQVSNETDRRMLMPHPIGAFLIRPDK